MRRDRRTRGSRAAPRPSLLVAAPDGTVYAHPQLDLVVDDGISARPAEPADLRRLPKGWELMRLPASRPLGFDRATGAIEVVERCHLGGRRFAPNAVAVHPPPGTVRTHLPAARFVDDEADAAAAERRRAGLPLWAYTAVGAAGGAHVAALFQVDETSRWDPALYDRDDLAPRIRERLAAAPESQTLAQLAVCATTYGCRCAQNIFYARWEGALPIAPGCNAACLGCLSKKPAWEAPVPQYRLTHLPRPEDVAAVMAHHLRQADEAMISFGQGCEGEPCLYGDVLVEAVHLARAQTGRGVINLNTNGSRPSVVGDAVRAGVGAVRVSVNSFDSGAFAGYFRPQGYGLTEVVETLRLAHALGAFTSINLLLWPGWTDRRDELEAISGLVEEGCLDMVQLRNLCVDPAHYQALLPASRGQRLGLRGWVAELAARHQRLRFGTFNPRLAAAWYRDLPPLPFSPLADSAVDQGPTASDDARRRS